MHPDLDAVVAADEECRSRLALVQSRRDRDLTAARSQRETTIEQKRAAALETLERELASIRVEGDARLTKIREQQQQYLDALSKIGDEKFDTAVQTYLAIVCGAENR
jgi:DNA anti-recombination protein RmuC